MRIQNRKGIALVVSLLVMVMLVGFASVFVMRTVSESMLMRTERSMAKALYLGEAAGQAGLEMIDTLINTNMYNTVSGTNPSVVVSLAQGYVTSSDGIGFLIATVKNAGVAQLTLNGSVAEYAGTLTALGEGTYRYQIALTEKANPVAVTTNTWDFSYGYRIESIGMVGSIQRTCALTGDFTVRVQRDNFAKYALFTNTQTTPSGTNVWFTDKTNFSGPVQTNGRFNFALNPGSTFEGIAVQHEQTARFYNNGSSVLLDNDHNGTRDVPTFQDGFTRGANTVTLTTSSQKTDLINEANGGQTFTTNGIYIPNNGTRLVGGIYVQGNANLQMSVDTNNNAVYRLTQGSTTKTVTVDRVNNQTTVATSGGSTVVYQGKPDGVDSVGTLIYVNGAISSLAGTIQEDTGVTISSENDILITNNIVYDDYTPASGTYGAPGYVAPTAEDTDNLLGLVSWSGNVNISTSAPDDITVTGTILARNGVFQVNNYDDYGVGPRGVATLLGGVITDDYGAFGTFNSSTGLQSSGYGRNFVYDDRMEKGFSPPYFPTLNTFIAFTNDITDRIVWQQEN